MKENYLQSLLTDNVSIGDLILAKNGLAQLDAGYQDLGVETPEWVTDKMTVVSQELINRNRAELQRRLKAAQARRAGLATAEEKRGQLDAEIAALTEKLK